MDSKVKYSFLSGIILIILFGACKKKDLVVSTPKEELMYCHQMPTNQRQPKQVRIHVEILSDSLSSVIVANNGVEFFLEFDSIQKDADLCQLLQQNIRYTEMLREMEIEGRWIYEINFEGRFLTNWTLKKSVKDSVLMEKEIEKTLAKLKRQLRYFYTGKRTLILSVNVHLYD
jgi:hypothetical protein